MHINEIKSMAMTDEMHKECMSKAKAMAYATIHDMYLEHEGHECLCEGDIRKVAMALQTIETAHRLMK